MRVIHINWKFIPCVNCSVPLMVCFTSHDSSLLGYDTKPICSRVPTDTTQYPLSLQSSTALLWEPQIVLIKNTCRKVLCYIQCICFQNFKLYVGVLIEWRGYMVARGLLLMAVHILEHQRTFKRRLLLSSKHLNDKVMAAQQLSQLECLQTC